MGVQAARQFMKLRKGDAQERYHTQLGALCWKMSKGKPRILLITSRETRRWIIPKGWPIEGLTDPQAAEREAWEEAGVRGRASPSMIGLFTYNKITAEGDIPCAVLVYPLKVKSLEKDYPEAGQRKRVWFGRKKAASLVQEPELARMLASFSPGKLPK